MTGGISTGKSTVSQILSENGFDIIDTDKISRSVSISYSVKYEHVNVYMWIL